MRGELIGPCGRFELSCAPHGLWRSSSQRMLVSATGAYREFAEAVDRLKR